MLAELLKKIWGLILSIGSPKENQPPAPQPPTHCTFTVVVYDEWDMPIEDAGVILSSKQEGFTNRDGYKAFTVKIGEPFSFSVHKDGEYEAFISNEQVVFANTDYAVTLDAIPKPVVPVINYAALKTYPRVGCSIAALVVRRDYPIEEVAQIYADCGVTFTTVNLLSAEWPTMVHKHVRPFLPANSDGVYDLYAWNAEHFERLDECREAMNSRGIVVQWCFYELYGWSRRKSGSGIPDRFLGPWKRNQNGVDWVGDGSKAAEDFTLAKLLPDVWSKTYLSLVVPHLDLSHNLFLIGNEFPEKGLHERVRDFVRLAHPGAKVSVNRKEETPGQYANMKIGRDYDYLNFHGRRAKAPSDLTRYYPPEESSVPTFEKLLKTPGVDPRRIIFSSDGARSSDDLIHTYDFDTLGAFFKLVKGYGCSIEHQSRAKMGDDPMPDKLARIERDFLTMLAKA